MDGKIGFPGGPDNSICAVTASDDGTVLNSQPAPAYKYCIKNCETLRPGTALCNRLGDTASNAVLSTHPWNLASGVTVTYTGGDMCRSKPNGVMVPRSLRVSMQCFDQVRSPLTALLASGDACSLRSWYDAAPVNAVSCER